MSPAQTVFARATVKLRQQVRRDGQSVVAVGGRSAKTPLATRPDAVLPHGDLYPALAHTHAAGGLFAVRELGLTP